MSWVEEVLGYWFGALSCAQWFEKSDAVDAEIARRFSSLHERVAVEGIGSTDLPATPIETASREVLARIIVLDQFPRNMFRGTPRAFATDTLALALARRAVEYGFDQQLGAEPRLFVYLPFEHSETLQDQDRSVRLFTALGDAELIRYAVRHQEIIARFGRFPHRNAILGRDSTAEELAFLSEPDSAF